jgi:hypothetical protein
LNFQENKNTITQKQKLTSNQSTNQNKPGSPNLQTSQSDNSDHKFTSPLQSPTFDGSNKSNKPIKANSKVVNIISTSDSDGELKKETPSLFAQNEQNATEINAKKENKEQISELEIRSISPISGKPSLTSLRENNKSPNLIRESSIDESAKQVLNINSTNLNSHSDKKNLNELKSFSNKVLVEKDGQFKLLTPEEYMAYEKESRMPKLKNINSTKLINLEKSPSKANNNHSNSRPRTSVNSSHNRNTANANSKHSTSPTSYSNRNDHFIESKNNNRVQRNSSSADFSSRQKLSACPQFKTHPTPEYALNYTSPYKLKVKIYKQNNYE